MGQSLACCTSREDGKEHDKALQPPLQHIVHLEFFDCVETEEELLHLISGDGDPSASAERPERAEARRRGSLRSFDLLELLDSRAFASRDGSDGAARGAGSHHTRECGDGVEVALERLKEHTELLQDGMQRRYHNVSQGVRDMWRRRIASNDKMSERLADLLSSGFPELDEWTTPSSVLRMLGAQDNDEKLSIQVLMQAIELRLLGGLPVHLDDRQAPPQREDPQEDRLRE